MNRLATCLAVLLAMPWVASAAVLDYKILHTFGGQPNDGARPTSSLILSGSTLYGMTQYGGDTGGQGTVFSMKTDGSDFKMLHCFTTTNAEGNRPHGSLTLDGSTLYGMTYFGGAANVGTAFAVSTDGTGFTVLHTFQDGTGDGASPLGSLTIAGSQIFGMTTSGGINNAGTIFAMNKNGSNFQILHHFAGGTSDGKNPYGDLTLIGSTLYGMTFYGGATFDAGTVFSFNTKGSNFKLLHSFSGLSNAAHPRGNLIYDGSKLYGMAQGGKSPVFSMDLDGGNYTVLHTFQGGAHDGTLGVGSLTLSGSTLYGMTLYGGASNCGTAFSLGTDGSSFTVLHGFAGGSSDGSNPYGSLVYDNRMLYGMTSIGGSADYGVIFAITVPEPSTLVLVGISSIGLLFFGWRRWKAASIDPNCQTRNPPSNPAWGFL